jgi:hypothetical protein
MSHSLYDTVYDNGQPPTARLRWWRTATSLLQLAVVALSAVAIGIYFFPVH